MTDEQKREIQRALEKATQGQWNLEGKEIWRRGDCYDGDNGHVWICDVSNPSNAHLMRHLSDTLASLYPEKEEEEK